ncbi:MAG: hypothetical protein KatS3mg005_3735 [Bryobacteraceae bacterium]|nr:MAG: hypothetical protein KatS3mg005_3735 [Bryobacteraceae bacterium]
MLVLSLVWGILAALGMIVAFFPCLGSLNWLNVPFSFVGLVISIVAVATSKQERKGAGIAGIVLCGMGVIFGLIRLALGGGVL